MAQNLAVYKGYIPKGNESTKRNDSLQTVSNLLYNWELYGCTKRK